MTVTHNGGLFYYVTNIQGDVIGILDASGNQVVSYTYDAWGNVLTIGESMRYTLGRATPLRYRGYVFDQETQLYYLQSRYYNPKIGRFINADGLTSTGQGLMVNNMFSYCNNNPIVSLDSTGTAPVSIGLIALGAIAIAGAAALVDFGARKLISVASESSKSRSTTTYSARSNYYRGLVM